MKNTKSKRQTGGMVYSTEHWRMCPACEKPQADCTCRLKVHVPGGDGVVRVGRETKGRKGKGVTLITGVMLDQEGLRKLARQLKQLCGSGGTVKEGIIEIQGDHRNILIEELQGLGWKVKRMGG
jgi:translation initiation factor 1